MTGGTVFENRYGRARCRHISTSSARPLTQPPDAPPRALPSVVVMRSILPMTPLLFVRPAAGLADEARGVGVVHEHHGVVLSASATISSSLARSPSIENTPSVTTTRKRLSRCSSSFSSRWAMSECLNVSCIALQSRMPSTIEACTSRSAIITSCSSKSASNTPAFASMHDGKSSVSSVPRNAVSRRSSSRWMSCVPQMKRPTTSRSRARRAPRAPLRSRRDGSTGRGSCSSTC